MKFWTMEVYNSWYDPPTGPRFENYELLDAAYRAYDGWLNRMTGILPPHLIELARLPGVDDGLLIRAEHDESARTLDLALRCGDLQMGYYDLSLRYEGAELSSEHEQMLRTIAETTRSSRRYMSDLFAQEIDVFDDGRIEHRLLFHPGAWFAIRCRDLSWRREDRPDREIPRHRNRFRGRSY